jgi:C-terminal processing protease CtpA/Prc
MSKDDVALLVAMGSLLVAALVHFASVERDRRAEARAIAREDKLRADDERKTAIAEVVRSYEKLRIDTSAGPNLNTVREAGIAQLESDAEVRKAIDRMASSGEDPLGAYRNHASIEGLDLLRVFRHSVEHHTAVETSIAAIYDATHGQ